MNWDNLKWCNSCKTIKTLNKFYTRPNYNNSNSTYYMPICKLCSNANAKDYRKTPQYKASKKRYVQTEKGKLVQRISTKKYSKTDKGKQITKKCMQKYNAKPERKLYNKEFEARPDTKMRRALYKKSAAGKVSTTNYSHRRRFKTRVGSMTKEFWLEICKLYKEKCAYCGITLPLTVDHVLPLSRGGLHEEKNILPACAYCNNSKGNKLLSEWRPTLCQIVTSR